MRTRCGADRVWMGLAGAAPLAAASLACGQCGQLFSPPMVLPAGPALGASAVAAADINGDTRLDLAVTNSSSNAVYLFSGNGDGTFQAGAAPGTGAAPVAIAIADLNQDTRPDLALAGSAGAYVLLGNGGGTFGPSSTYAAGGGTPCGVAVADFNMDGRPDLAIANTNTGNPTGFVAVLLGNGDGTFQPAAVYGAGAFPRCVVVGDFDANGRPDMAVANSTMSNVSIFLGRGDGTFQAAVNYSAGLAPYALAAADINGDGRMDLLAGNNTSTASVCILLGNGDGVFQAPSIRALPSGTGQARGVAVAEFDRPGQRDLMGVCVSGPGAVLLGPSWTSASSATFPQGGVVSTMGLAAGDFNGDGRPDAALSTTGGLSILLNIGPLGPPVIAQQPVRAVVLAGQSASYTVARYGSAPVMYQWRRDGAALVNGGAISGATSATLDINPVSLADNGAAFDCVLTNACGETRSNPAGLGVGIGCYPNCDNSTTPPILNVNDFACFLNRFAAGCP